mmetsp:Transcript_7630/g.9984  ORF Transcript_7630/g.9984 Transcript_7630/m.9984 type:complete len:215 (+) Transcript_7630:151-795(+)|eukprot:CAMPEP_0198142278 /NCGR_PEP_ID=MMETSP1443-20131203/5110_1 /TAXON_ID=186043 /ORGANISM="Entomoneis sp., Strain CCMP2396" /LENGTH=214 /DNA_ID=CAMNT_0043805249 /DNA_START=144 /DNA_END=788 /DNA_ORIENTATION=+
MVLSVTNDMKVSEQMMEFLISELVVYVKDSCTTPAATSNSNSNSNTAKEDGGGGGGGGVKEDEEALTVAAEMAAAKLERIGFAVGYRLTERLAQNKTWNAVPNQDTAAAVAAQQLEAVKFLCKEIWMDVFGKQIDKLQTNHRGVFVLKDLNLKWLTRFPSGTEQARVSAIRLLAFPCGLIRGCLSNLGIPAVVSCDFLSDGQNMAACSFNIKVK